MEIKKKLLRDIALMTALSGIFTPLVLKLINPSFELGYLEFTTSLFSNFALGIFIYFTLIEGSLKSYFESLSDLLSRLRRVKKVGKVNEMKAYLEISNFSVKGNDFLSKFSKELLFFLNTVYEDELLNQYQKEINDIFGKTLESRTLASKVYQFLYDRFGVIAICFYSQDKGEMKPIFFANFESTTFDGLNEFIESDKVKVLNVNNTLVNFLGKFQLKSVCIVPLVTESWKGAMILGKTDKFKGIEVAFYRRIRHSMAQAFRNAYIYELLRRESSIDPLTGLYNRRFGLKRLREIIKLALRENKPIAIGMLDIDNFKRINDTYGHLAGDYILKKIAEIVINNIRENDLAVRFGGEEILIALYNTNESTAKDVFERIRKLVESYTFKYEGQEISVTVSIGYHVFYPMGKKDVDVEQLIDFADKALYDAKSAGKNLTVKF
ncbi:GGDEF domain-containing protein [Desulfurobacterium thermolithotrophum]|uniref:GGDEF domain-containing protein n=1 Tax=Desulfurobacterium thermolithotrophum TaxID=64160 RepID=UPI0013D754DE|nr:GGDEF domain-containing protein [Desulfurobacterium thermolithotrophum]